MKINITIRFKNILQKKSSYDAQVLQEELNFSQIVYFRVKYNFSVSTQNNLLIKQIKYSTITNFNK